jgi:hypothetical protein
VHRTGRSPGGWKTFTLKQISNRPPEPRPRQVLQHRCDASGPDLGDYRSLESRRARPSDRHAVRVHHAIALGRRHSTCLDTATGARDGGHGDRPAIPQPRGDASRLDQAGSVIAGRVVWKRAEAEAGCAEDDGPWPHGCFRGVTRATTRWFFGDPRFHRNSTACQGRNGTP